MPSTFVLICADGKASLAEISFRPGVVLCESGGAIFLDASHKVNLDSATSLCQAAPKIQGCSPSGSDIFRPEKKSRAARTLRCRRLSSLLYITPLDTSPPSTSHTPSSDTRLSSLSLTFRITQNRSLLASPLSESFKNPRAPSTHFWSRSHQIPPRQRWPPS